MSKLPTRIWRNRLFCAHCSFEVFDSRAYCLNPRCVAFMPEGHNRQQESAQNGALHHVLPKPRPRRALETEHQETASQRFLRRFGAGDTVAPTNTTSRAMKNPIFTASAFPPAYVPSPKVAGGVFSSGSIRQLLPVDFRVAVPVT
ncbi:hypothetical protein, partial [Thalassospira tepidiphila]